MKIGILTFHRAENFGAVMQAYALQEILRDLGGDVSIIDYRNRHIEAQYHIWNPSILWSRKNFYLSLKSYINRVFSLKSRRIKKRKYAAFRTNYLNIQPISIWRECALLITGSDQVWNLHLTGGFDPYYFLDFPVSPCTKRISYAASSDNDPDDLLYKEQQKIQAALRQFDGISVREDFLRTNLSRFVDSEIAVLLDPTFLLEYARYNEMAIPPKETGYICVYHMTPTEEGRILAERMAAERNLKVVELFGGYTVIKSNNICKCNLSPEELLGYIQYAEDIVTTSFHGIAFSIKFHKNFWVINKGDNFRQKNILAMLGLSRRLVNSCEDVVMEQIDYSIVDEKLQTMIAHSVSFISQWLK